ncbi:hypothetical protein H4R99_005421 [Coemansia sp. RSA 1722]|nr:hypothetical protein IWW45_001907 [Coemansia sp. RSA 485]KAJ2595266.1 hypothetical protein H4R99_005421 [Coemansia sp. RSA 1722]
MATQTPPRLSADRDRMDMRMTPTPTPPGSRYQRPSFIPLPTHLSTPLAPNSNNSTNGLGARASTSLLVQRPSDSSATSRSSYDDARTGRSSSLSARTNSPALNAHIPGLARPAFPGYSGHSRTHSGGVVGSGSYADEAGGSEAGSARNSMAPGRSSSMIGGAEMGRTASFSSNSAALPAIDDADDGQRELPVRVAVRIRPLVVGDGSVGGGGDNGGWGNARGALTSCLELLPKASIRMTPPSGGSANGSGNGPTADDVAGFGGFVRPNSMVGGGPRTFKFDYAFGADASQTGVYETAIAPLLQRFVEGYNVTILAYGQTSSGKTFTMGTDADDAGDAGDDTGIVPRALAFLFAWTQAQAGAASVRVSFLEVYNEELIDLVAVTQYRGVRPPIFIREDSKGNIQWTGVKEVAVGDARGALALLAAGSRERQTSSTRMNGKSSRSHAIYSVTLEQTRARSGGGPVQIVSKLHFVDLAGSERLKKTLAEGERKREGISINSGLLALGNVISALGDSARTAATHVPYRDSKLTHMLRDSLGGTAQTLLIACVSAADANAAETLNTLKYASRARNIRNCGGVNMVAVGGPSAAEVQALRAQVRRLRGAVRDLEERLQARDAADEQRTDATIPAPRGLLSPPSKIPTMAVATQRRAQTAEELAALRTRNQALEAELEQLNDTYTELLLKFNDACRDIEERQNEGFARDQRLRDREHEIRKLTGHSRHSRRIASGVDNDARPASVAEQLRSRRRSALLGSPSDVEGGERVRSLVDGDAPELPDLARLRGLQRASSSTSPVPSPKTVLDADAAPGAAEFDAMMEEYDTNIHALEAELRGTQETIDGLRLQLTMQETKASFAEKLNASQAAQIDTLRAQLAKARDAALEEEERRRAVEAELEEATISAETQLEAANDAWRQELSNADELWNERWDAVHAEHALELAHLRTHLHAVEGAAPTQMLSPPSTAHEEHDSGARDTPARVHMQLEADLAQSLADVQRLEADVDQLRIRALDADARAAAAEHALAELSARLAETSGANDALARDAVLKTEAVRKAEARVVAAENRLVEMEQMAEARIAAADKALASATQMAEERIAAAKADAEKRAIAAEQALAAAKRDAEEHAAAAKRTLEAAQMDIDQRIAATEQLESTSRDIDQRATSVEETLRAEKIKAELRAAAAEQALAAARIDAEARVAAAEKALAEAKRSAEESAVVAEKALADARLEAEARAAVTEESLASAARMAEERAVAAEQALATATHTAEESAAAADKALAAVRLDAEARAAAAEKALATATQTADERAAAAEKALAAARLDAEQRIAGLENALDAAKRSIEESSAEQPIISRRVTRDAVCETDSIAETSVAETSVQTDRPTFADKAAQFASAEGDAVPELPNFARSHSELPRRASDKIVLCARNSIVMREPGSESPAEQRLRSMRHRHSTAVPPKQQRSPAPAADKFASYPELRLLARNGPPVYDEDHIQAMLRDAAMDVDRQSDSERERRALLRDVAALRDAKKELQERNSQMQNLMRELGDRLVTLAEENDLLEAKAAERDALAADVQRLAARISELEAAARDRSSSRPASQHSFHSAAEDPAVASYDLIQLQSRLNIAEAELTEALLSSDEHQAHASQLLHELEQHKIRLAEMEEDLAATMHQLDAAREDLRRSEEDARNRDADAQNALAKQTDQVSRLRDSLTVSEDRVEEARQTADRYANELVRVQAEAKAFADQLDAARKQLDDAQAMAATEARDRDVWKGRCQDLREEVNELRARRRQSKILCF